MSTKNLLLTSVAAVGVACLIAPAAAIAQTEQAAQTTAPTSAAPTAAATATENTDGAGDVVVTATRMGATSLQKTPLAVSVLSSADLDRSAATDVRDLVQLTPNLNVSQNTASPLIYIRGIGTNAILNGSDPDVTVQIDGVYLARAFEQFTDFFDVQRLEVLRGPQGTLYGRNAVGGVINIISRPPTDTFTGKVQATVGNYGTFQGQGYVSGPIVKGLLDASVAVNYLRHDGYIKNLIKSGEDDFSANHGGVRVQLRFRPATWLDATTRFDYGRGDENTQSSVHLLVPAVLPYTAFSVTTPTIFSSPIANSVVGNLKKAAHDQPLTLTKNDWGVSEDINVDLSDSMTLKSLTAYRFGTYNVLTDNDGTEVAGLITRLADTSRQFSQEFDLTGHFNKLTYVVGVYYFRENERNIGSTASPPGPARPAAAASFALIQPYSRATSKAVFAQASYSVTPALKLTVGGRYTSDEKYFVANTRASVYANAPIIGAVFPGFPFIYTSDPTFHAFTPKVGVEWQATRDVFVYASYTKGFKSGGNNSTVGCNSTSAPAVYAACLGTIVFQPEKIDSYEAGIKTFLFDRRVTANLTGFYYDYKNLQVQSVLAPGVVNIGNAATARTKGLEFETQAKLTDELVVSGNVSYLHARYLDYPGASVPSALRPFVNTLPNYNAASNTVNASGNRLTNAPDFSFNVASQYTRSTSIGSVYGRAEFSFQSRIYFEAANAPIMSQGKFGLLNLAVGYTSNDGAWTAAVVAKNVLDRQYYTSAFASGIVPAGLSGAPRTVQLRVSRNF